MTKNGKKGGTSGKREEAVARPVVNEIAVQTIRDRYSSYPSQGLTPYRLAAIFKEADQGDVMRQAELFEEMEEKDLHLAGILQTRKLVVSGLEWEVLPASDAPEDKKIAEAAKEMVEYVENWDDFLLDMLDAVGKGFAVSEIMWELSEGLWWIKECKWVHQRRFTFNTPTVLLEYPRLITDANPVWGEELVPNKFLVHKYRSRSGHAARGGLLRPCAYGYLFKNYDIKDWLVFNELFSVPMRIGKYKQGTPATEIKALKQAVFNLGVDAAAVVSDTTLIELLETKATGTGATSFQAFADFWDRAMSKAVLGHTGSVEGTPGKLGSEDQAKDVRQDLLESDAKALMKTIKFQLLAPWTAFNFGPDAGVPKFDFHFEGEEDLEKTARMYGVLVKEVNFEGIPEDHLYERFDIPRPTAGQKTVKSAQTPWAFGPPGPSREDEKKTQANKATLIKNRSTDDWVSSYMQRIAPALQQARAGALDEIEAWLKSLTVPPTKQEFVSRINTITGSAFASIDKRSVTDAVTDAYTAFRLAPGAHVGFGGPDIRAMQFLSGLDSFYVSSFLRNPDAAAAVSEFLSQRYLEEGANLFQRGTPEDVQAFRDLFSQKLIELEDWQIRRIVDTSVSRIQNWASINRLYEGGIMELEIYEPTRDCDFCKEMNGRVISVPVAYETMSRQAAMTPEEYETELKRTAPTVDNIASIVGKGMLPPYHPHCRGIVIKRTQ